MSERSLRAEGFTLIEVLVALSIISVGLLGLLPLSWSATRANATARHFTEAHGLAQATMEKLKVAKSYAVPSDLTLLTNTDTIIKDELIEDMDPSNSLTSGPEDADFVDEGDCELAYYTGVVSARNVGGCGDNVVPTDLLAGNYDGSGPGLDSAHMPGGIYLIYWNVVDNSPRPFMKSLRVAVRWQENGQTKEVAYTSIIAVKELQYY